MDATQWRNKIRNFDRSFAGTLYRSLVRTSINAEKRMADHVSRRRIRCISDEVHCFLQRKRARGSWPYQNWWFVCHRQRRDLHQQRSFCTLRGHWNRWRKVSLFLRSCLAVTIDVLCFRSQITVLLIDSYETVTISKNVEELYVLPDEFKKFPPQAVDIRIAGVVPVDLSVNWDKNLIKVVKLWLSEYKNFKSKAFVELALMKCIWVKSVELFDFLSIIREEVVRFDVTMEIVRQNLGIVNPNWLHNLRRLAGKAGTLKLLAHLWTSP